MVPHNRPLQLPVAPATGLARQAAPGLVALTLAVSATLAVSSNTLPSQEIPACDVPAARLPQLTLLRVQTGRLEPGEARCFGLSMEQGEFLRASLEVESGYVRVRVLKAHDQTPLLVSWVLGVRQFNAPSTSPVAFEAPTSGLYVIELSVPVVSWWSESVGPFRLQVHEWLSAKAQAARREDLRNDPRTEWLREHATAIRSVNPADEDFADLEFLREQLASVRVVLLGEGAPGHGGASERMAKTRLVRFLHREMGFDVLAFESGLFSTAVAWRALQRGGDSREAFLKGAYGNAGWAEELQPLIHFLATEARTDQPLELAGFDSQFSGTASRESLLPDLREFLARSGIESPLADSNGKATLMLQSIIDRSLARDREQLPSPTEQAALLEVLRATASQVEKTGSGRAGEFWAQVLRSAAVQAGLSLDGWREWHGWTYARGRDRQMAENLLWLVERYTPQRKMIVWAHTFHAMRNPQYTTPGREQGFTMGHGVWEALGEDSFVIASTSYAGTLGCVTCTEGMEDFHRDIVTDQHPSFEFEELMHAAGHELAWVNLRKARAEQQWLGGAFLARPVYSITEQAPWSEVLDALLFIHTQEPSRRVAGVR